MASLSHRWSVIRLHPVRQEKGRKCIVSPFDGVEAARPDLWYPPFSLTKLRCGRAFSTCSLPRFGRIPAAGALLVTSRGPLGTASSGLAPLPIFPRCCMWILFSCLLNMYLVLNPFLINHQAAIFPLLNGLCFFFVGVCVFNLCYWAVIVSFLPPFANRAIHFHLVAIATFW